MTAPVPVLVADKSVSDRYFSNTLSVLPNACGLDLT